MGLLLEVGKVVELVKLHGFWKRRKVPTGLLSMIEDAVAQLMSQREPPAILVPGGLDEQFRAEANGPSTGVEVTPALGDLSLGDCQPLITHELLDGFRRISEQRRLSALALTCALRLLRTIEYVVEGS